MNCSSTRSRMSGIVACWVAIVLLGWPFLADGKEKLRSERQQLDDYLQRVRQSTTEAAPSTGSLWTPEGTFANLAIDYKARYVNDLITIRITEQTRAEGNGSVQSQRTFEANSGISALFGLVGGRSGLRSLFSPGSERGLNGQVQTSSNTVLQTRLTGHVVEVLPNGYLVIKAVRAVKMKNERVVVQFETQGS